MVKFSRELDAQLIPEWKEAFINYRQLKKHIKRMKLDLHHPSPPSSAAAADHPRIGFSILDPLRYLVAHISSSAARRHHRGLPSTGSEENLCENDEYSMEDEVNKFFERLDEELEKVKEFHMGQENELCERGETLRKQLHILIDIKKNLHDHRRRRHNDGRSPESLDNFDSPSGDSESGTEADDPPVNGTPVAEPVITAPQRRESGTEADDPPVNGTPVAEPVITAPQRREGMNHSRAELEVEGLSTDDVAAASPTNARLEKNVKPLCHQTYKGSTRDKANGGKRKEPDVRINIPGAAPSKTILAITSMIWEELIDGLGKDGAPCAGGGDHINRKKMQCAEKMLRGAFIELYRGLMLLRTYSSLNMLAFRKILKKFDKVSNQHVYASTWHSQSYMTKVKTSHFISSDKVVRLTDEVESIFTTHFTKNDRKKAMKFLRPQPSKESHIITFFLGIFSGSFVSLLTLYAMLAYLCGIFSTSWKSSYMETVYPVFSMFALLSLHIFVYGCNLFMWRRSRINHNLIFEFSPNTALKHRDAFLISTSMMTLVLGIVVIQLMLQSTGITLHNTDAIFGFLLLLFTGILLCPFNVLYRSTRYCFLRVIRNIVFSPICKVLMVDFFMADQLTSQIPLLKHMELTACYLMAGRFKMDSYPTCTRSYRFKMLAYITSFLPYYFRTMQCARRYIERYDAIHLANAGKYVSAMLAAAANCIYAMDPTPVWLAMAITSSAIATIYQLYWDFAQDWGILNPSSKNPWLRDRLILKNKNIYYISIAFNLILRLTWIETVLRLHLEPVNSPLVDFLLASLEIVRRGHWNFYRLENEHLNNVGKFRAVTAIPLPFCEMGTDG